MPNLKNNESMLRSLPQNDDKSSIEQCGRSPYKIKGSGEAMLQNVQSIDFETEQSTHS